MTCLNDETKSALISEIAASDIPQKSAEELSEFIEKMPKCTTDEVPTGRRGKRPLSKYNLFMKGCLGGENRKPMADCVILWRKLKAEKKGS